MNSINNISKAVNAINLILDSVIPELDNIAEFSKNELRSAKLILKDAEQGIIDHKAELSDYLETYSQITRSLWEYVDTHESNKIKELYEQQGTGGLWLIAEEYSKQFDELHKNKEWDGEFFDEIEIFMKTKI